MYGLPIAISGKAQEETARNIGVGNRLILKKAIPPAENVFAAEVEAGKEKILLIYSRDLFLTVAKRFRDDLSALDLSRVQKDRAAAIFYGQRRKLSVDGQGRIVITDFPSFLKQLNSVKKVKICKVKGLVFPAVKINSRQDFLLAVRPVERCASHLPATGKENASHQNLSQGGRIPILAYLLDRIGFPLKYQAIVQPFIEQLLFWGINLGLINIAGFGIGIATEFTWLVFVLLHFLKTAQTPAAPSLRDIFSIAGINALFLALPFSCHSVPLLITGFAASTAIHIIFNLGKFRMFAFASNIARIISNDGLRYVIVSRRVEQYMKWIDQFGKDDPAKVVKLIRAYALHRPEKLALKILSARGEEYRRFGILAENFRVAPSGEPRLCLENVKVRQGVFDEDFSYNFIEDMPVYTVVINEKSYLAGGRYYIKVVLANGDKIYWGGSHNQAYSFWFDAYREDVQRIAKAGGQKVYHFDFHTDFGKPLSDFRKPVIEDGWQEHVKYGVRELGIGDYLFRAAYIGLAGEIYFVKGLRSITNLNVTNPYAKTRKMSLLGLEKQGEFKGIGDLDADIINEARASLSYEEVLAMAQEICPHLLNIMRRLELNTMCTSGYIHKSAGWVRYINPDAAHVVFAQLLQNLVTVKNLQILREKDPARARKESAQLCQSSDPNLRYVATKINGGLKEETLSCQPTGRAEGKNRIFPKADAGLLKKEDAAFAFFPVAVSSYTSLIIPAVGVILNDLFYYFINKNPKFYQAVLNKHPKLAKTLKRVFSCKFFFDFAKIFRFFSKTLSRISSFLSNPSLKTAAFIWFILFSLPLIFPYPNPANSLFALPLAAFPFIGGTAKKRGERAGQADVSNSSGSSEVSASSSLAPSGERNQLRRFVIAKIKSEKELNGTDK